MEGTSFVVLAIPMWQYFAALYLHFAFDLARRFNAPVASIVCRAAGSPRESDSNNASQRVFGRGAFLRSIDSLPWSAGAATAGSDKSCHAQPG